MWYFIWLHFNSVEDIHNIHRQEIHVIWIMYLFTNYTLRYTRVFIDLWSLQRDLKKGRKKILKNLPQVSFFSNNIEHSNNMVALILNFHSRIYVFFFTTFSLLFQNLEKKNMTICREISVQMNDLGRRECVRERETPCIILWQFHVLKNFLAISVLRVRFLTERERACVCVRDTWPILLSRMGSEEISGLVFQVWELVSLNWRHFINSQVSNPR